MAPAVTPKPPNRGLFPFCQLSRRGARARRHGAIPIAAPVPVGLRFGAPAMEVL